ncbi:hypothetical protein C5C03_00525 [Clavibacter michiganensis]|uniref:RES domain-containing protein n=1 Tax=Clavibacter michiganensis TaxID=28447 RepID=UPI000CE7C161|nr:RES domain-containing protein [Clavibacter michiganensis]PPF91340.1 hypothetical protein C5C03_00525 [Clavibacter michiganensis]PPF99382.1 hypothetical protein C5C05_02325 [Clavibacter michiganensis]
MSGTAADDLLERVDAAPRVPWSGDAFRYTAARRDPLSGAGARIHGGRWNPPGIFSALYLGVPASACMAELERAAQSQGLTPETLLAVPYKVHTLAVSGVTVLDLRDPAALASVGLTPADIAGDDWEPCQALGHAAWFLGFDGVLASSASGTGSVLTLFEGRLGPGQLRLSASEVLTVDRYTTLRSIVW